jgi:non-heme chloroperoxidase
VVLIHGWPLSGRSWEKHVPALVFAGHRVITYDRRGFGSSSQPWGGYDYDTFAADLDALLGHLDLCDVTLAGFSIGGRDSPLHRPLRHRARGEDRAGRRRAPYLYKSDENPEVGLDDATIQQFKDGVRGDCIAFLDEFTQMFFAPGGEGEALVSELTRLYHCEIASFASPKGTPECIEVFGRTDFREDLAKIGVPTLIIHGDSDAIVPFKVSGHRSHQAIPYSSLTLIEGAPTTSTPPPEQFNRALLDFLG